MLSRASEHLAALPREYRIAPHLPFSPPPQPQHPHPSSSPHPGPRQSIGDFLPSPGPVDSSLAGPSRVRTSQGIEIEEEEDVLEEDEFQLARSYFDMKEFDRVAYTLREARGNRARFLRTYAAYLVSHPSRTDDEQRHSQELPSLSEFWHSCSWCRLDDRALFVPFSPALDFAYTAQSADRKAQESLPHFLDTKEERIALYPSLNVLVTGLADETEPYLVYLRGILHMRLDQRHQAMTCFTASVKERPYNWGCWSQLGQMINSADLVKITVHQVTDYADGGIVHRAEGEPSCLTDAHLLRYHRHAGSAHCHRPGHEYDQGAARYLPRQCASEGSAGARILSHEG